MSVALGYAKKQLAEMRDGRDIGPAETIAWLAAEKLTQTKRSRITNPLIWHAVKNIIIDYRREIFGRNDCRRLETVNTSLDGPPAVDRNISPAEIGEAIYHAMVSLRPFEFAVFVTRYYYGLSDEETAEALKVRGSAKYLVAHTAHIARSVLKKKRTPLVPNGEGG